MVIWGTTQLNISFHNTSLSFILGGGSVYILITSNCPTRLDGEEDGWRRRHFYQDELLMSYQIKTNISENTALKQQLSEQIAYKILCASMIYMSNEKYNVA